MTEFMRRLFRKGERVRSKIDGKVMEVLKYIKNNFVEVKWFDQDPGIRIIKSKRTSFQEPPEPIRLSRISG